MYADGNTTNERPGIEETYASALSNGSTRVGNDSALHTSGDIIAAAGMNRHRMGLALNRLISEWNSGAVPKPTKPATEKELRKAGLPSDLAQAEARRRAAECSNWHLQENMLRFQRLKTLPEVRAALLFYVRDKGWEGDAEMLVADVLRFFLSPKCPHCLGRGSAVIPGTNRAVGRECKKCRGTGEVDIEHGGRGRSLFGYLKSCTGRSAADLREGAHRLRRSGSNDRDRQEQREGEEAARQRRADAEAKVDLLQDTDAVAAKFRDSLAKRERT